MSLLFWNVIGNMDSESVNGSTIWRLLPDLLSVLDMPGAKLKHINPAWTRVLGWQQIELVGKSYLAFVHPEDRHASEAAFQRAVDGEPIISFEHRCRCEDGAYRWLSWAVVPDDGRVFARALDITEQKEAMLELAARTIEREQIWALSQDMLGVADSKGHWISISPAFERILGWDESMLLGRTSEWLEHPDDREQTRAEIAKLATGKTTLRFKNRFLTSSGSYRWLSWTAVPHGGLFYCVGREESDNSNPATE